MNVKCNVCGIVFDEQSTGFIVVGDEVICKDCCSHQLEEYKALVQSLGDMTKEVLEDDATGDIRKDVATVIEYYRAADTCVAQIQEFCDDRIDTVSEEVADALDNVLAFIPTEDDEEGPEGPEEPEESKPDGIDADGGDRW